MSRRLDRGTAKTTKITRSAQANLEILGLQRMVKEKGGCRSTARSAAKQAPKKPREAGKVEETLGKIGGQDLDTQLTPGPTYHRMGLVPSKATKNEEADNTEKPSSDQHGQHDKETEGR